jgi:TonB family protein
METVGPPSDVGPRPEDAELNLLTEWGDPASGNRTRTAAILSVAFHVAVLIVISLLPPDFLGPSPRRPVPEITRRITPLVEPLTEFTQTRRNRAKLTKEIDVASLQPRERIQAPKGSPSTTRQMAPRPAEIPSMPENKPPVPAPLPEPPKIEAVNREVPRVDLPSPQVQPPPQIQAVEKPKLALENVAAPPPPVTPEQRKVTMPTASVQDAIRQNARQVSPGGGIMVGDPGAGPGGVGEGINLPPSPGIQGSALELKSDPMGVDFRPYLTQILATIRRNWYAVMPESVKLGRRGKVGLLFSISRVGKVDKVTYAFQSGSDPLDRAAVAAISASNPFPPLPHDFKGDRVVLQLNFGYNIPKQ